MANLDSPPPSTRVLATGATESGKTSALRALFAVRYPRVLVLDYLGTEWPQWESAQVVETFAQLRALLAQLAARPVWRIVCNFDEGSADVTQLVALLGPKPKGVPFPRAAGGMTLLCDEVDLLYPLNANDPGTRSLWARGRHAGLTILAATQRLPQVHRVVSAQSQWLVICRQHEPGDLEAIARRVPPSVLDEVWKLEPFGTVVYRTDRGRGWVLRSTGPGHYVIAKPLTTDRTDVPHQLATPSPAAGTNGDAPSDDGARAAVPPAPRSRPQPDRALRATRQRGK